MTPKLTVVITAYDRREFVERAILSVLAQTLPRSRYQIILIKNFRSEDVDSLAEKHQISSVLSRSSSLGDNYVEALEISDGDVLCFLDDDDLFDRRKLEVVSRAFSEYPDLGYFHNRYVPFMREHDQIVPAKVLEHSSETRLLAPTSLEPHDIFSLMKLNFNCSSISVKREIVASYSDVFRGGSQVLDVLFFYAAILSGRPMMVSPEVLTYFRIHQANTSRASPGLDLPGFVKERLDQSRGEYNGYSKVLRHCVGGTAIEKVVRFQLAWTGASMNIYSDHIWDRAKVIPNLARLLRGLTDDYPVAKVVGISLAGVASILMPMAVRYYSYSQRNRVILDANLYELS